MKLNQRQNHVQTSGTIGDRSDFSIALNSKMFKTLSDSLYQDKIGSMVRELTCNAVDAHGAANKSDVPVVIHLPNALEPWFSVKDEGVGLSDEDVRTIYNTYGASTKDQDNDAIGGFGLGSKTPFAYTDQFTVTSVHGGMERVYVAVIGDDGMPHISLQFQTVSDAPPGVEITVSIMREDFSRVEDSVIEQLMFLPVLPILYNNMRQIEFPDRESGIYFKRDYISVYKKNQRMSNSIHVVQGGVGYRLSINRLNISDSNLNKFLSSMENAGAIIEFPIGEIEVTASREGISYNDQTIANIINRINHIVDNMADDIIDSMRAAPNDVERAVIFNTIPINGMASMVAGKLGKGINKLVNGRYLFSEVTNQLAMKLKPFESVCLNVELAGSRYDNSLYRKSVVCSARAAAARSSERSESGQLFYPKSATTIVVKDKCTAPISRLKKLVTEISDSPVLFVTPNGDVNNGYIKTLALMAGFDVCNIVLLSSIEGPSKTARSSYAKPTAYVFSSSFSMHNCYEWTREYEDLDELPTGIIVGMHRNEIESKDFSVYEKVMKAVCAGVITYPVYAVNSQTFSRVEKGMVGQNHISVEDAYKEIEELVNRAESISRSIIKYQGYVNCATTGIFSNNLEGISIKGVDVVSKRINQLKVRLGNMRNVVNIDYNVKRILDNEGVTAATRRREQFLNKYPMLNYVGGIYDHNRQDVIDYIELINSKDKG